MKSFIGLVILAVIFVLFLYGFVLASDLWEYYTGTDDVWFWTVIVIAASIREYIRDKKRGVA